MHGFRLIRLSIKGITYFYDDYCSLTFCQMILTTSMVFENQLIFTNFLIETKFQRVIGVFLYVLLSSLHNTVTITITISVYRASRG